MKNNNKYNWNLEPLLKGKSLNYLYAEWVTLQKKIIDLYPKFCFNVINFENWLNLNDKYEIISNRLMNYVSNNYQENLSDQKWISYSQKISIQSNKFSTLLSNYENIVIKNEKKIRSFLQNKNLIEYKRMFELIFKTKKHLLTDVEEKLLSKTSVINSGFDSIFSTLVDSDIKFPDAIDSKNKKVPLKTIADINLCLKSNDRSLRKSTWISFNKTFVGYESTLTQTLYYNYLMLNTYSKIRNFENYIEAAAFSDELKIELILHIYKMIEFFKSSISKYSKIINFLLKKQLNLTKLEPWDKTVDLNKKEIFFTIEETQKIILNALKPLGNEYVKNVKKAFNEKWISWNAKPNKQTGAYSIGGTKGLNQYYISMNFDKTIRSVSTIAHELGHSMHSLYFNKKQRIYADCEIFYAEISSIVNETLLSYYFLDFYQKDEKMTNMILDEFIGNFFNTTTRQIIFSNFEFLANDFINKSKPFTKESMKNLYIKMIEKYQGISKEMKLKISDVEPYTYMTSTIFRIGHFYAGNFYVYKYAVGQIVALIVATKIYSGDKQMIKKYFDFLSSGSSKSPLDTIKILGIDLYKEEPYLECKKIIDRFIEKIKK